MEIYVGEISKFAKMQCVYIYIYYIYGFPKMVVAQWKTPLKWDDLGGKPTI